MSAKLAMKVFESGLEPHLKPLAVAAALFGNDAGGDIYPSVSRLAGMVGATGRTVQRQLGVLRDRGILIPESTMKGGARRTVHYRLDVEALPERSTWKPRHQRQGSSEKNPDADVTLRSVAAVRDNPDTHVARTLTPVTETLTPMSRNPDTGVTRSVSDQSVERDLSTSTGADAPAAVSENANAPTFQALCQFVRPFVDKASDDSELEADLVEELKNAHVETFHCSADNERLRKAIDAEKWTKRMRAATTKNRGSGWSQVAAGVRR